MPTVAFSKRRHINQNLLSAAVVISALRFNVLNIVDNKQDCRIILKLGHWPVQRCRLKIFVFLALAGAELFCKGP